MKPEQIALARESLGFTQVEMAMLLCTSTTTICRWERGRASIKLPIYQELYGLLLEYAESIQSGRCELLRIARTQGQLRAFSRLLSTLLDAEELDRRQRVRTHV